MDFIKIFGLAFVGAIVIGLGGVIVCQASTSTPKFCGLMILYSGPIGFLVGLLAGAYWVAHEKKRRS